MLLADDRVVVAIAVGGVFLLILTGMIPWQRKRAPSSAFAGYEKEFTAYESGKHRRYELLFAVNGGAFALAKLFPEYAQLESSKREAATIFLGHLTLDDLALGMIAFTLIMALDIAAFGIGMRNLARRAEWTLWTGVFSLIGFLVLFVLCILICAAWYLSQRALTPGGVIVIVFVIAVGAIAYALQEIRKGGVTTFTTKNLPEGRDAVAPDGSDVRVLPGLQGGGMAHFELPPGETATAVMHRTVEEIWYFLSGHGQMWRQQGNQSEVVEVHAGVSLTIPLGTQFQFRSTSNEPLAAVGVTMPPWPGEGEAVVVTGPWQPSVPR